ncbi:TerC family protein [Paenibacillus alkalitolerans]|uniref:TerC family protein n=1 Tax=Paenibacillus alkalitolerans TaxID=2799335 RepID=UPI0018F732C2|nr:TerC family protein [Paenibacillus alkalitolerans]
MEIMSPEFWTALISIIFIDLVLAGDNAIVIGMASRKLPPEQQKKAIIWGTVGAVAIRIFATIVVVELLKFPGLSLAGGLLLVWIAYKLLVSNEDHKDVKAKDSLGAAIWTIVIADAAMGIDNVMAVAGAAHGDPLLVIIGLIVSVPIVVWGSTLFIKLINRFPSVLYIGAGVLAYTSAKMITHEKLLHNFFTLPAVEWSFMAVVVIGVLVAGRIRNGQRANAVQQGTSQETNA